MAGIRQRTGTLLAAHALVASFLGTTVVRSRGGLHPLGWVAMAALVSGLVIAAILLAPWRLRFAVYANDLYDAFYEQAAEEAPGSTLGWLVGAGYGYQRLLDANTSRVRWMSLLSGALGVVMVAQTLSWLAALAVE